MTDQPFLDVKKSYSGQRWVSRLADANEAIIIAQKFDIPEILARVIAGRNVDFEHIGDYLNPTLRSAMPEPYGMQDMEKAAKRIAKAIVDGETIGIIGDYDVDGATSTALFLRYVDELKALSNDKPNSYKRPKFYIPDRQAEGYGPSKLAVDVLVENSCSLILTVDCGILAYEPIEYANEQKLDIIVLDHHMADEKLPEAYALVNPNRQDDLSGLGHLAACGVCFITLVAVSRILREQHGFKASHLPNLMTMLDLVALGTVCDVVSLTGLNRAFVNQGLKIMSKFNNLGIKSITEVAQVTGDIAAYHLGYVIGPRINAGGRVGNSRLGSDILSTKDQDEANSIALHLDDYNKQRQAIEQEVLDSAFYQAEQQVNEHLPNVIIVADKGWHQGVIGIVAGRIKDKYNRPTIVIGFDDKDGKGSGRSINGVDLGNVIQQAVEQGLIIKGGGHKMAAGLTIKESQLAKFRAFIEQELSADVVAARRNSQLKIDGALTASAANLKLLKLLTQLEPYGVGNSRPVFAFPAHHIAFAKVVGKGHLKLSLKSADGSKLDAIAFGAEANGFSKLLMAHNGKSFHFVGNLSINRWQGRESVQLQITDIAEISY